MVTRAVLSHGLILSAIFLPPTALALIEGELELAAMTGAAAALCIGAGLAGRRLKPPHDLRAIEAVCTLVILFLCAAVLPVPAFQVLGLGPLDALFESVSGITSTGLSVAGDIYDWPLAGHLLRGWLLWCGGFAIAVAGSALILGPGNVAQAMGEAGIEERDILSSTRTQARALLWVYSIITLVSILALRPVMPNWWESAMIALSAVSTGGFSPRADSLASYSTAAQVVTMIACLATSVSLLFYVYTKRHGLRAAWTKSNARAVLGTALAGSLLVVALLLIDGVYQPLTLLQTALNFVSGMTTAGFSVAPVIDYPPLVALVLAGMFVGGGIGSTAGGIKIDRALLLAKSVRLTLTRLRAPARAVTNLTERGREIAQDRIVAIAAVLFCYVAFAFVFWLIFIASGIDALHASFEIISAQSTAGLSVGVSEPALAPHLKATLIAAMLLGRLEFVALIAALSPATWRKRS
ncbi:TrkH family potassium uptake protein [Salipiger abyssi]|uniref:Trk system potassium uptake protein TrkH n=1 Tax=Salipiger abyssi TaxID=1250539 RepID=A0A1P8UTI5_9RHOB|nr:potassium transporter TrkG [Salipiger abyssi]APZ52691.1 trk system potassium uptake protein TrkH [Salipiger abyssi]